MSEPSKAARRRRRRVLGWVLAALFVTALVMGPGPGVLLVNEPRSFLNFPLVYMWGLLWYAVEVLVVIAAYLFVWRDGEDEAA
ncbi:MAG: hypothetical protein WD069_06155 [Planctomycetales bacterium]